MPQQPNVFKVSLVVLFLLGGGTAAGFYLLDSDEALAVWAAMRKAREPIIETEESQEVPPKVNPPDPSDMPASKKTPDDPGLIGTWWRDAGALSGKLRIKKKGTKLTENWTFMSGDTLTRKLVESEESGLRRFDLPESAPHNEYYILQEDGWLRLGDPDGVFQVIPPDSLNLPSIAPPAPSPQAYKPARQQVSCDGLEHLDPWNGEIPKMNWAVRTRLKDPNSLEVLKTKIGPITSLGEPHYVFVDYTAKNSFGGRVRNRASGYLNHYSEDVRLLEME